MCNALFRSRFSSQMNLKWVLFASSEPKCLIARWIWAMHVFIYTHVCSHAKSHSEIKKKFSFVSNIDRVELTINKSQGKVGWLTIKLFCTSDLDFLLEGIWYPMKVAQCAKKELLSFLIRTFYCWVQNEKFYGWSEKNFSILSNKATVARGQARGDFLEVNKNVHREVNGRSTVMKLSIQKQQRLCNFCICCFHNFSSFKHGAGNFFILHKYLRLEIYTLSCFQMFWFARFDFLFHKHQCLNKQSKFLLPRD